MSDARPTDSAGRHATADGAPAELVQQVRDALRHLHDPTRLQTHPLARRKSPDSEKRATGRGKKLQNLLLAAIEAMRPSAGTPGEAFAGRSYRLLVLRYVDGLDIGDVQSQLGISKTEYYVEHQRAIDAVASWLEEWYWPTVAPAVLEPSPDIPRTGGEVGAPRHHNLPVQLASFVGRENEIVDVSQLLSTHRLVTLTGTGGCGKTRLALQVASTILDRYPDGIWLVELAPLADPNLIGPTVATVFGIQETANRSVLETLVDALRSRELLLILDNCEHLIEACARVAEVLLGGCPSLRILATSREGLGLVGELSWRVPSLPIPSDEDIAAAPDVAALSRFDSIRLFVERARLVAPRFTLTAQNGPVIARICRRLDGIPLAIELAAARVKMLTIEQIAARLDDQFHLLTGGSRTALPRQQTLKATIDWSYNLLSELERCMLRRLAVFVGGWSLEAAEAVCVGEGIDEQNILDLLTTLMDKSLVLFEKQAGEGRYRLLETIRTYGCDRQMENGETDVLRGRHRDWFLALVERAAPELRGRHQMVWLDRLELDEDNVRAALVASQATVDGTDAVLKLVGEVWWFWFLRGNLSEGTAWLERAIASLHLAPDARAKALAGAGFLADFKGDYSQAATWCEKCLALARDVGDRWLVAFSLVILGDFFAVEPRDYGEASARYEQGLAIAREVGDKWLIAFALAEAGELARLRHDDQQAVRLVTEGLTMARAAGDRWLVAFLLFRLGNAVAALGDYATARSAQEEGLAIRRDLGDRLGIAYALLGLGNLAQQQGDDVAARAYLEERLEVERALDNRKGVAHVLNDLGRLAHRLGEYPRAKALFEASLGLCREMDYPWGIAHQLYGLGQVALAMGDWVQAHALFESSLALTKELGYKQDIVRLIDGLARVALCQGDVEKAEAHYRESLTLCRELGHKVGYAAGFEGLANVAGQGGQTLRAARLFGVAERSRKEVGAMMSSVERATHLRQVDSVRALLGQDSFASAWAEGQAMTLDRAVADALGEAGG